MPVNTAPEWPHGQLGSAGLLPVSGERGGGALALFALVGV